MNTHSPHAIDELSAQQVAKLMKEEKILLIDVREPDEYAAHLTGGIGAWTAAGLHVIEISPVTGKPVSR
jgi:rhodanese-related sulfurtransferase